MSVVLHVDNQDYAGVLSNTTLKPALAWLLLPLLWQHKWFKGKSVLLPWDSRVSVHHGKNTEVYNSGQEVKSWGGQSTGRGRGQDSPKGPTPDKSFLLRFSESSKIMPPARDQVFKTSSCEGHLIVKPELILLSCIVTFLKRQLHLWLDFSSSDVHIVFYLLYILKAHWVENYDLIKTCILMSEYFYPQTGRQPWYPSAGEWLNKL